jgi:hypothetical protein
VIPHVVVIDPQVIHKVTTTHPLQPVTVKGAGVDPAGGGTRYPATRGIARKVEIRCESSMLMIDQSINQSMHYYYSISGHKLKVNIVYLHSKACTAATLHLVHRRS